MDITIETTGHLQVAWNQGPSSRFLSSIAIIGGERSGPRLVNLPKSSYAFIITECLAQNINKNTSLEALADYTFGGKRPVDWMTMDNLVVETVRPEFDLACQRARIDMPPKHSLVTTNMETGFALHAKPVPLVAPKPVAPKAKIKPPHPVWDNEEVEKEARKMLTDKASNSAIAKRLSEMTNIDVTPNAVAGFAWRSGIKRQPKI